jgi:hypothetical protein
MIVPTLWVAFFIRRVVRRSDDDVCIEDRPPGRFMRAGRRFSFERNKSPTDQVYRRSGSGCWAYPLPLIMPTGDVLAFSREDSFEAVVLPHLDAAHNLARWLMRDADAAEDVLQDAIVRR